jgi:hypothetical protein
MTTAEIKTMVMFQTNNDADDLGDFMPHLMHYINEGYDLLHVAFTHKHPEVLLTRDIDTPVLPPWSHRAIADYATWLVYRNGNPSKQQRGYPFHSAFEQVESQLRESAGAGIRNFYNIPE